MTAATTTNKQVTVMASDDMRAWVPVKELKLSNYKGYINIKIDIWFPQYSISN